MNKSFKLLFSINPFSITIYLTLLIVFIFIFIEPSFLEIVELKTLDLRFKSRGTMKPHDAVVLAVIDERVLTKREDGHGHDPRLPGLLTISQMMGQRS